MRDKLSLFVIGGIAVMFAFYFVAIAPRDAKQDALRRDMDPPFGRRQYLFTSDQFIDRCGRPKIVTGETLDYGEILVAFRPAFDGTAAHFYQKGRSEEIDGSVALKQLGCTL